ncbi:P-loop containing nucleoside triphosphate hydrolase protein [Bimuria novae-zelandiae CBS 107.79]|uniref:DNA 3'-5' helicase n=1 Tax=Bimuria novae-zelandiae CBS 107.79 TaxID=1447943 RepID=A0A6A5VWN3_9PLEO|nr:P-loop containing nucleoside triphosphate hydrolase protein [Bimuria novae-zelandiae CBS 107.79]
MSFTFRNRLDGRGANPPPGQFSILEPQFKQPARPRAVPPRDRYRVPRQDHTYGRVEDDGMYGLEQQLDSFDERLLQQPHIDRQSGAARGQARLSLAPQSSRFFAPGPSSQMPDPYRLEEDPQYGLDDQFTYNPTHPFQESSSDVQFGVSSSPAFKASQRRVENIQSGHTQPAAHPHHYNDGEVSKASYPEKDLVRSQHQAAGDVPVAQTKARSRAPTTQGIQQIPVAELPDKLRTIFPYPIFNAVQSKCFHSVYKTDNNFVLASPTGSGKTVVLELAICRAITKNSTIQYKIIYQAPTKSLCSERQRDWQKKFSPLGLNCVELTGDSDSADLRNVQSANIIITTPEKWDSITRKWKDHEKLMRLINLFLIDEVHLLKEDRGATLEAVVARMKSIGTHVRFVALSATVPNFHDVATWLGKNTDEPREPALNEQFGEEFRPVRLRKHVCGYQSSTNDFAFEKHLDTKLPDVVRTYSEGKPIMVFCFTRKSTEATAKVLANWWVTRHPKDRAWRPPTKALSFQNKELRECAASGVAFHHAGIDGDDRVKIEKAYLDGELSVICCTSTLAVGVNLPCHLVIIKNTVGFAQNQVVEYSDLEVMQMLGRAGRPQFDDSAVAVIMTRQSKVRKYELMVTGQEVVESTLHLGLVEHLNAEIGLGTIRDLVSARKWLASTFLYVRIKQNPVYYKLEGSRSGQSLDEQLDDICFRDITLLREHNLMAGEESFRCTEYGYAMAQYYVQFNSMRTFMGLAPKATISEIASTPSQASEFETVRFRAGEKSLYKSINKSPYIRFPIPVNLDLPAHKVSLLIQSVLGGADISWDGEFAKHRVQYNTEAVVVFKQTNRLIRCIIDCQIYAGDSVSINNALIVERSLAARVWDDSPLQMKQIDTLGVVGCRKLAQAGIRSLEELECTDAHRIEYLLGRNPPYGLKILEKLRAFPKLRVSLQLQASSVTKAPEGVKVMVKTDIGFINEQITETFAGKVVYVCLLAETSDGRKAHFARISAKKVGNGQSLSIPVLLMTPNLSINCYIMCDGIAGTMRTASVTPKIAASLFPPPKTESAAACELPRPTSNMSRRRTETPAVSAKSTDGRDEFDDDSIDDDELVKASLNDLDFDHIDNYSNLTDTITRKNTAKNSSAKSKGRVQEAFKLLEKQVQEPRQLVNGKWACNHACKDKDACKHLCCKEGMDKPPKKPAPKRVPSTEDRTDTTEQNSNKIRDKGKGTQSKLQLTASKRKSSAIVEELDLTQQEKKKKTDYVTNGPRDYRELHKLHKSIQKKDPPSTVSSIMHQKPSYCYGKGGAPELSFLEQNDSTARPGSNLSSDYGDLGFEDLSTNLGNTVCSGTAFNPVNKPGATRSGHAITYQTEDDVVDDIPDPFDEEDSMLEDIMLGVADSEDLRESANVQSETGQSSTHEGIDTGYLDDDLELGDINPDELLISPPEQVPTSPTVNVPMVTPEKGRSLFLNDTSSPEVPRSDFKSAKSMLKGPEREELDRLTHFSRDKAIKVDSGTKKRELGNGAASDRATPKDVQEKPVPDAYKDIEPWLFQEFGGIIEIVE